MKEEVHDSLIEDEWGCMEEWEYWHKVARKQGFSAFLLIGCSILFASTILLLLWWLK